MTQVWFRNPKYYIREMVEVGEHLIAWDRGILKKGKIDPVNHGDLYFGKAHPWRALAVGAQGSAEYRSGDTEFSPTAVYPTWQYGENQAILEEIISQPLGEDEAVCKDLSIPGDEKPVFGQEHRVVIIGTPRANTGPGKAFFRYLKDLQEDYPDCIIHVHGLYSFRVAFGMGWGAADYDARVLASKGKIVLPTGKEIQHELSVRTPRWVSMFGLKPVDLTVPRNRCIYNIKSAVWAGENFAEMFNMPLARSRADVIDTENPDNSFKRVERKNPYDKKIKALPGDKQLCNTCSLQLKCTQFRLGAVCSLPESETRELASYFKTRDSDLIIDGLGTLLAANTRRAERGMKLEEAYGGEIDKDVTNLIDSVFKQAQQLAKLVNPELRGGAKVNVNVGGNAAVVSGANPREMVASVIRALEERGWEREDITPDVVKRFLSDAANSESAQRILDAKVIDEQGKDA